MQTITIHTNKGGTGKTTTALELAFYEWQRGKKVLLVDLDSQQCLTYSVSYGEEPNKNTVYDVFGGLPITQAIAHTENSGIDIVRGDWQTSQISTNKGTQYRLQNALKPLEGIYDFVIIDTPPAIGEVQYNALIAADKVILPVTADIYCYRNIQNVQEVIEGLKTAGNNIEIAGLLLTMYDGRSTINKQFKTAYESLCETANIPFLGTIRQSVLVKEAQTECETISSYAPGNKVSLDYKAAFDKLKF